MHRSDFLPHLDRGLTFLIVVGAAACAPTATPPVQPVQRAPQLVPAPASMALAAGAPFNVEQTTGIYVDGGPAATAIAEMLAAQLRKSTEFPIAVGGAASAVRGGIILRVVGDHPSLGNEGYELTVSSDSVRLIANQPAGLFHGIQTIRQLLPADIEADAGAERSQWPIAAVSIVDQPRFAWRGAMMDVARHFFTVDEVEQFIDILAL